MARFPSLYRRGAALAFSRLSPGSRMRRAILRRAFVSGWDALTRRDFKLMLVRYAPDVEWELDPGLQTLGLDGTYRGHAGMVEALGKLAEAWDSIEVEPAYVLDLGDRVLGLGLLRTHARASGLQLEEQVAQLLTVSKGLITQQHTVYSWEDGMRAVGLDLDAIALPARGQAGRAPGGSG